MRSMIFMVTTADLKQLTIKEDDMSLTELEQAAWELYCDDTAGGMDVKDFWWKLSVEVRVEYLHKARVEI